MPGVERTQGRSSHPPPVRLRPDRRLAT